MRWRNVGSIRNQVRTEQEMGRKVEKGQEEEQYGYVA